MIPPARPVIGITRCSRLAGYMSATEQAGGDVRVLNFDEDPRAAVGQIDGLLLTGGGDINPHLYGEARHPSVQDAEPGRDGFEIELVRLALGAALPLLAICRGAQVLNVAAGGTLVQDIPSLVATRLAHHIETSDAVAHTIAVAPGSRLAQALGRHASERPCAVNSRHHQSVDHLGSGLVASARAEDGVVEAIERPDAPFCLGVQWHPEDFWRTGEFRSLFDSFVAAAGDWRRCRTAGAAP